MLKFFSFNGRLSRLGYWRVGFICTLLIQAVWIAGLFGIMLVGPAGGAIFLAIVPVMAVNWATQLRRLHDRGKNVWWLLLFAFGPLIFLISADLLLTHRISAPMAWAGLALLLAGQALNIWGVVEVAFLRGHQRPNQHGDVPAVGR